MGSGKVCMNTSCGASNTREWKRGWPLRSGDFALLCFACGSAYENSIYCDTFHLEESGWRECAMCSKRLHCGCISSESLFQLLDFGGVGCSSCVRSSRVNLIQNDRVPNGFVSLLRNNDGDLESIPVENIVIGSGTDEGKLAQLCRLMEASEANLIHQSEGGESKASLGKFSQEELLHPIGEVGRCFSNGAQPLAGSSTFPNLDKLRSMLDMGDIHGSLAQPSLSMTLGAPSLSTNFVPFAAGTINGKEQGDPAFSFQQGPKSRPILSRPSKSGPSASSETNNISPPEPRIARPPAEGRGKNQLLPRYWPRITDQELQQLSGDLNSNIVPLFEKVLSASDAGRIGRLVLPKACAEAYFPHISQSEGVPIRIQDVKGREWTFQFRFWPNNNSRMYVLEGVTPCIQSMQLRAGDTITFSRIDPGGKLVLGYRKATNNSADTQDDQTSSLFNGTASGEASLPAEGDVGWNKNENQGVCMVTDSLQQPVAASEKKKTRNIGPKNKRLLMHNEDALELRLTWEEAQDLLRPPADVKPTIFTIDDHEFEEYDEPPVFGKRTIFTAQPSGRQDQWAQCDECYKWRKLPLDALLPAKWSCSENIWDPSRGTCSAPEEMNLKDMDNLLRVSRDFKKRRTIESRHKLPPEREPSGLDALASAAVLGEKMGDLGESSVVVTTKHPRHRPGCTCIVCIQPPSGKGKHKPTCTCNVCLTVKRRFKTLMLRKKKRLSEREGNGFQKENADHKEGAETNGTSNHGVLDINKLESEGKHIGKQCEVAETSSGQIDLNFCPNREETQDIQGLSVLNAVGTADLPLDGNSKPNELASITSERPASIRSCLLSQASGESSRQLSDEAFLASVGWDHENKG